MTGFSAEWLALRAPADDAARDRGLVDRLIVWAQDRSLAITDIGGGSGAACRALAPHLPNARWRVLDDDAELLALLPSDVTAVETDLAASQDAIFDGAPDLITAFAFIDLVSADWLASFAMRVAEMNAALYVPLTYDGREIWRPEPPHEAEGLSAFNKDMQRNKGFGPALGGGAALKLAALMQKQGYTVQTVTSEWRLSVGPLMTALTEGSIEAVRPYLSDRVHEEWSVGRRRATEAIIGHTDLLALPPR